jgi:hypothetical protein
MDPEPRRKRHRLLSRRHLALHLTLISDDKGISDQAQVMALQRLTAGHQPHCLELKPYNLNRHFAEEAPISGSRPVCCRQVVIAYIAGIRGVQGPHRLWPSPLRTREISCFQSASRRIDVCESNEWFAMNPSLCQSSDVREREIFESFHTWTEFEISQLLS